MRDRRAKGQKDEGKGTKKGRHIGGQDRAADVNFLMGCGKVTAICHCLLIALIALYNCSFHFVRWFLLTVPVRFSKGAVISRFTLWTDFGRTIKERCPVRTESVHRVKRRH